MWTVCCLCSLGHSGELHSPNPAILFEIRQILAGRVAGRQKGVEKKRVPRERRKRRRVERSKNCLMEGRMELKENKTMNFKAPA